MQLREDIQLQTAIRALSEVVMPAVDAANALAVEQLQVVIGMLSLMAARLPLQFRYDCDELARLIEFAQALENCGGSASALRDARERGADVAARAQAEPQEVLLALRALRETSGALITALYRDGNDDQRAALTRVVLAHADQQLLRERAWVLPQGWEAQPESLPAIETLLAKR